MTRRQLKARRLRKLFERKRNVNRNKPAHMRAIEHMNVSFGPKRAYRLYDI